MSMRNENEKERQFKDLNEYINYDYVEAPYTTKQVLDVIYDKNIDGEQLKAIRRSLIFDNHIDLNKLIKDHQWYIYIT